ncbi:N-acetylmuramoyl-L-alanine amidase [uncultured Thiomicrorhabdus sp.]
MREINTLVIHCSATKASMDIGVDEITEWHRNRGFFTIGYHFVIRRDGTIENGRMIDKMGAHAKGHNRDSFGICMVGGLDDKGKPENNYTAEQWSSLSKLTRELYDHYPIRTIVGHRDLPKVNKACPCFDVNEYLAEIGLFGDFEYSKKPKG